MPSAPRSRPPRPGRRARAAAAPATLRLPAARRRALILAAFRSEALERGSLAAVGMRAVVERAGCTAPVLYRLFGSRDGLVRAAVRSTHEPLLARLVETARGGAARPAERIRALARAYLRRVPGDEELFEALVATECRRDPEIARSVRQVFAQFEALLAEAVEAGRAAGDFRADVDARYASWRLIDLGLFRNQAHLMGLEAPLASGYAERAVESLLAEIAVP